MLLILHAAVNNKNKKTRGKGNYLHDSPGNNAKINKLKCLVRNNNDDTGENNAKQESETLVSMICNKSNTGGK